MTGRFGLIVPEINSPLDYDFIDGAYSQAEKLGYDLIVYAGIYNSSRELRYDSYILQNLIIFLLFYLFFDATLQQKWEL